MIKVLRKIDKPLFFVTVFMFLFGLIMIFSASYVKAITMLDNAYYYLIRQAVILCICLFVFLFIVNIPTQKYKKNYKLIIYLAIIILCSLYFFGITVNGAKSWLPLPIFNFQPSELAKIAIIIYMAYYYERNRNNKDDYTITLKPFIYAFIVFFLVATQPDLGSAIIIFGISFLVFCAVPLLPVVRRKTTKIIGITILFGIVLISVLFLTG